MRVAPLTAFIDLSLGSVTHFLSTCHLLVLELHRANEEGKAATIGDASRIGEGSLQVESRESNFWNASVQEMEMQKRPHMGSDDLSKN